MSRLRHRLSLLVLVAVAVIAVGACGSSSGPAITKMDASSAVAALSIRVVIDVRTPAEFAAQHIAGSQNIDVEAADFGTRIASLDKAGKYLVYCHSGRRSGIAAQQMASAGFKNIVDGGALADLIAAGAPTQ
jgi:rhodanese-related sulfurtransferase